MQGAAILRLSVCIAMCAAATPVAAAKPKKPNILLIMVDDMGWSDLGCYGGEIRTPNIDSLATNGARFRRFFNNAKCGASRVDLLTHAAMIDCIDQRIGDVLQKLNALGVYENTLILFCADNGAEKIGSGKAPEKIGTLDTFFALGKDWSNVANTPHRMHKLSAYNGGSRTSMILHWPNGIKNPGRFADKFAHLYNVMPTLLELSGVDYPDTFNGISGREILGDSFTDVLYDEPITHQDPVYMNRGGQAFVIDGGYKLVTEDGKNWSLYNLNLEETEINDLSQKEPERFNALLAKYKAWRGSIK